MALDKAGKADLAFEMSKRKYKEAVQLNKIHICNKNKYRNLERCMHTVRRQQEQAETHRDSAAKLATLETHLEREENLARELSSIKQGNLKELKMRQALRENSDELRKLESQLKAAYVSKELAAQRAEKEALRLEEKLRDKEAYRLVEESVLSMKDMKYKQAQEEIWKKAQYRQELQDQIIINDKRKRCKYEEFLREKKMIDDIVQRIYAEDEREVEDKMCRMRKTREEMNAFKEAQQLWRNKERDAIALENRKIKEFIMNKAVEMQSRAEQKSEAEAAKNKLIEAIGKEMHEKEMMRREREEMIQEIYEEEQKQKSDQQHREKIEMEIRQRVDIRQSLDRQMMERHEKERQEAAEDAKYKEELIAKIEDDKRLELLSDQKRRMKMLQMRRDVEQMMVDRRQKKAEEMQLMMRLKEQDDLEVDNRKRIIEEERMRMLKEHAHHLIGYLPKGVLRLDDLEHLGNDVLNLKLKVCN